MSAEQNKELVRRYFEAIDERRDPSVIDEFVSPDFVDHSPSPGFSPDFSGLRKSFSHFLEATPDGYHRIEDMVAEGDKVVTRLTAWGTQSGELFGIPPAGKEFQMTAMVIHRIADGKIVERWHEGDFLGAMIQLGVVPPPPPPPEH